MTPLSREVAGRSGPGRVSLVEGAALLGIPLGERQLAMFERYSVELRAWNERVNLTAIIRPEEIEESHFVDSLTLAAALPDGAGFCGRLLDVGTGGGFPGLPLKIALPALNATLIEATAKKAAFLNSIVAELGLAGVEVLLGRAEALGRERALRGVFDVVVARALGRLPAAMECCVPFARIGGLVIVQKKGDIEDELRQGRGAAEALGAEIEVVRPVDALPGARVLVIARKQTETPERYPRRPGIPAKRPLRSA